MVYDLVYQAKRVIDTLYNHLFDNPEYEAFSSSGPSCVKPYGYDEGGFFGAESDAKGYASEIQDRVASVALSASSAAAEAASTLISSNSNDNNNDNHDYWISIGNHHGILERLQSIVSPDFWHQFDPTSTIWDSITPDLHALQSRLGLDHIARTLNVEPRILFLAMLLPLITLLLSACFMAGAGNVSEDGPHPQDYGGPGRKTDPTNVRGKENQSGSSSSRSKQVSEANSHTSSNTGKSGKNRHGSKKGEARDQGGSLDQQHTSSAHQHQLGSNNGPSSWATMLGSKGFMGAEAMNYKPIDIIASLKKLRGSSNHTPEVDAASATSSIDHAIHDEGIFSTIMEGVFGPSDTQNEQDGIDLDNQEGHDEGPDILAQGTSKSSKKAKRISSQSSPDWKRAGGLRETNTDQVHSHPEGNHSKNVLDQGRSGRQGAGPAGPGSESLEGSSPLKRTRVPRAHQFKEADRHHHQPHDSYGQLFHNLTNRASNGGEGQWNVAAKIVDFAQGNAILRTLDGISGGVLGVTTITFATFVNVAEAAVTGLKMSIPSSLDELTRQLKDDFGRVIDEGDLEGSGVDQDDNWSFRNAATRAENGVNDIASSSTQPTESMSSTASFSKPATTNPTTRKHKDTAATATGDKDYASNKTNQTGHTGSGQRRVSVDDIWVGPHTASAVYAEPIKRSNVDKDAKKKVAGPFADDGQEGSDDAVDPPKAKGGTLADRDTVAGAKVNRADIGGDTSLKTPIHSESSGATRSKKSKRKKNKAKLASQGLNVANADQETAHRAGVHTDNTAQDTKKAAKAVGDSVRKSEATVERDIRTVVQKAEDTALRVVGGAKAAMTNAEDALQMAARDTKKTIDAARSSAQKAKGALAQGVEESVKGAKGAAQGWVREAENVVKKSTVNAEDALQMAARDTKKTIDIARSSAQMAKDTLAQGVEESVKGAKGATQGWVREAEDVAQKSTVNAEDALQMAARDTKKTIDIARSSAQKAKGTLAQGVEESVKGAKGAAQGWVREAEDAIQKSTVNAAHQAKATVDSAVGTVQDVMDTGLQRASLTAREAISAAKDSIARNVVEPTIHAEHIAESISETCQETAGAGIQDAHDAVEKFDHDMKAKVPGAEAAAHKTKSSPSKKGAKGPHGTRDSANASASKDLGKDESKTKSVSSSRMGSKVGDKSPEPRAESEPPRDVLTSAKHLTGGLGDATSEALRHGASIAAQAVATVTDNTTALLGAAKSEILGTEMEHKHDRHGQHKELRDIKNEMKHEMHHQGVGSSQLSAAEKTKEVAKEYYDSLPKPQESSSHPDSTCTGTQRRKSKSAAIPMLDHDNYVFMDRDGGQIHMDDIDDDADDSDGSAEDDDQSEQKDSSGILSHTPSILQSAKLAASAVAARVADVSYENFDIARHSLSDMIDNLSENLAGHDEPDEPDEGSDGADEEQDDVVVVPPTKDERQSFSAAVQRPASSTTSTDVQRQQKHHTDAHASAVAPTRPSTVSDHAALGNLSYSGAVKLNKDESDHGPMYGTDAGHTTKRPSQGFIHPHDDYTSGSLQGAESHEDKSHSHGTKGRISTREPEPSQEQEYTVDEHGDKVVFDARRDSGFDLLV